MKSMPPQDGDEMTSFVDAKMNDIKSDPRYDLREKWDTGVDAVQKIRKIDKSVNAFVLFVLFAALVLLITTLVKFWKCEHKTKVIIAIVIIAILIWFETSWNSGG